MTVSLPILELIVVGAFLAGVGASTICQAIIRAALTAPFVEPEPEVIVVEAPQRRPPAVPARQRFATLPPALPSGQLVQRGLSAPVVVPAVSPAQWARRSFDDPSRVRLAVQIGA